MEWMKVLKSKRLNRRQRRTRVSFGKNKVSRPGAAIEVIEIEISPKLKQHLKVSSVALNNVR